jgi:hypothetical protein
MVPTTTLAIVPRKPRSAMLGRRFNRRRGGADICSQCNGVINLADSRRAKALRLLQSRLDWYGFRSVKAGQLRQLGEHTFLVDLHNASGTFLCRIEIDRESGALRPSAKPVLVRLLVAMDAPTTQQLIDLCSEYWERGRREQIPKPMAG